LPHDWEVGRLDDFFNIQQGKQVSKANRVGNNQRPFLRTSNIFWGNIDLSELDSMHFSEEEERKFKLNYNDLLVCEGGDIGRTAIWKEELAQCYYQNHLHRVRAKQKDINAEFALLWLHYAFVFSKVYLGRANITTIPNLSKSRLAELIIPRPSFKEQRKIAYILNTIQKAIEQQDKLIKTTTELKKALMKKLFTEGTKGEDQKQTEIGLVPESWEVVRISDMYEFTSKPRGLKIKLPVPFIPMEMVPLNEMFIRQYEQRNNLSSGTYVENGDLLLAKITPSFENGKQGIVSIDKPYSYATTEVIPIKDKLNISDKYYLFYYLLKDDIRQRLTGKMEGSTGRQRLSKTILEKTLIPKPPIEEQKQIANIFIAFDNKISVCNKKKQILTNLFKTLLHELMTGQRRVHELEFETLTKEYTIEQEPLSMVAEE
jgi:type I restriction enzyme, S subunit